MNNHINTLLLFTDTNECLTDNRGCDHTCTNAIGSFYCSCDPGYTLQNDGATCLGRDNHCSM